MLLPNSIAEANYLNGHEKQFNQLINPKHNRPHQFRNVQIFKKSHACFRVKILLTNTMSLAPKIGEVTCFMTDMKPDLACITGTWLNESISESFLCIEGHNFIYKNRSTDSHGGVVIIHKQLNPISTFGPFASFGF